MNKNNSEVYPLFQKRNDNNSQKDVEEYFIREIHLNSNRHKVKIGIFIDKMKTTTIIQ